MRKTRIDLDEVHTSAQGVLEQAVQDPSFAQLMGNPMNLAQQLNPSGWAGQISDAQFLQHPNEYCIDIPSLGIHLCLPIGGVGSGGVG